MGLYRGAGGVVWEITPPDESTMPMHRERFDEQLASGALVPVEEAPAPKRTAAPKAEA